MATYIEEKDRKERIPAERCARRDRYRSFGRVKLENVRRRCEATYMTWKKYGVAVVLTDTKSREITESLKSQYWIARVEFVSEIGGKVREDGGELQVVRCERRGSIDRGEQKNTLLIKEGAKRLNKNM